MPSPPARSPRPRIADDQGVALIIALIAIMLMMALGTVLVVTTMTEEQVASNYRDGVEALYAADAAAERAIQDLLAASDWSIVLNGTVTSTFVDGLPGGVRALPGGRPFDLTRETNMLRCGNAAACGDADMDAVTEERPWGRNNPRWQPYAHGPLSGMLPGAIDSLMYVVVWVADDPAESDDDPLNDGLPAAGCAEETPCLNLGRGVMTLRAHAYGPNVMRVVEVTLARAGLPETAGGEGVEETGETSGEPEDVAAGVGIRVLSWREVR